MRAFYWLWAMFLLVCLTADTTMYWVVRNRLGQSMELALDAALVGSIAEEDLMRGKQFSHKEKAEMWAQEVLRKNLDGSLSDNLAFHFDFKQDGERIWAEGQAKVEAPFLIGALAGRSRREIEVSRKLTYQGSYK